MTLELRQKRIATNDLTYSDKVKRSRFEPPRSIVKKEEEGKILLHGIPYDLLFLSKEMSRQYDTERDFLLLRCPKGKKLSMKYCNAMKRYHKENSDTVNVLWMKNFFVYYK